MSHFSNDDVILMKAASRKTLGFHGSVRLQHSDEAGWRERSQFVAIAVALLIYSRSGGMLAQAMAGVGALEQGRR